jgi:hypothetical protein
MGADPTDDELLAFANTLLGDLPERLRDLATLREAIEQNRNHWVLLYHVNRDLRRLRDKREP